MDDAADIKTLVYPWLLRVHVCALVRESLTLC